MLLCSGNAIQFVVCALGAVRHRMLPDDGPKGPKHVGAIKEKIF